MQNNLWVEKSYPVFLYTGIVFFVVHLLIYGLGVDQSYFGLVLAFVGYSKMSLSWWVFAILWLGIILEGLNLGNTIYERYLKKHIKPEKKKKIKKSNENDE